MRFRRTLLTITIWAFSFGIAFGQTAEERVRAFVAAGDTSGLSAYTLAVVADARDKNAIMARQSALIAEQEAALARQGETIQQALAGIQELRAAIVEERAARDKVLTAVNALSQPSWKRQLAAASQGAAVGGAIGRNAPWTLVGTGAGWFIEWISTRGAKP